MRGAGAGVGKTCLMLRYAQGTFCDTFITTVGIDYKYKFVEIDGKRVRLEIWDTAGQERFKAITRSYLRGAEVRRSPLPCPTAQCALASRAYTL